jgi:catechol 2,3-dioxygenase-like lactoylglutathione lyase family enzyme
MSFAYPLDPTPKLAGPVGAATTPPTSYARTMPRHHHVNLGVPTGGVPAQIEFLTTVLGYRRVAVTEQQAAMGVQWFEGADGSQIHLSEDPDHAPPRRAHVAVVLDDDELATVEARLAAGGIAVRPLDNPDIRRFLVLRDPSGNRWELRSES